MFADDPKAFGRWAADRIEEAILFEGPDTVAAVFLEPVQNAGGCFPPPPGYFERVREICDRHDVLLVSDEVICAFGRLGTMFACEKFGYVPDIITCAKGMTLRLLADRRDDRFGPGDRAVPAARRRFPHGYTFGGHPVAAARRAGQPGHLREEGSTSTCSTTRPRSGATLEQAARPADRR